MPLFLRMACPLKRNTVSFSFVSWVLNDDQCRYDNMKIKIIIILLFSKAIKPYI
jgi:hypothetical protein